MLRAMRRERVDDLLLHDGGMGEGHVVLPFAVFGPDPLDRRVGQDAGKRFSTVQPAGGFLAVKVLVDKGGTPVSATAAVKFQAKATGKNGPSDMVVSKGQYFMHILEGGWTILGYSVSRNDHPLESGPTPSGSSS